MQPKRFSNFAKEATPLDGDKIRIDEVLDKEIEVIGCQVRRSKYEKNRTGKCLLLQMIFNGSRRVLFTGSDVLIEQLEKYSNEIPFVCIIKKIDRYYIMT